MNFNLAQNLFFFTIKATRTLIDYFKPKELIGSTDSEILLEKTARIGTLLDSIYADKKVGISDLPEIISILKEASGFIGFDFEGAAVQIANATKQELEETFKKFDQEFIISDKNKEANLEILFHEIFNVINSINRIVKICGKIKK